MRISLLKSRRLWKSSGWQALAVLGIVSSVLTIAGISFAELSPSWINRLLIVLAICLFLLLIALLLNSWHAQKGVNLTINGTSVRIRQGDLFSANGWKVIPFNEHFDTVVDDRIISSSSLNGLFINNHVSSIEKLQAAIAQDDESGTRMKRYERDDGRVAYPLGRIIVYEDYLLLALTHFNEKNMAHISSIEYQNCLMNMWHEISRTYNGKPIYLPLLGSGITRFDDAPSKSHSDLLECMIYTLRFSGKNLRDPITILLTEDTMKKVNLYDLKGS